MFSSALSGHRSFFLKEQKYGQVVWIFRTCTVLTSLVITAISSSDSASAEVVTFGSGLNAFTMDFTAIGSLGNAADTTGSPNPAGAVSYAYKMGTYEVSEDMITKYNANFGTANSLVITKDSRGVDKPATSASWNEAARYVNWLNTSTGGVKAYKFTTDGVNDNIALWSPGDLGYDAANLFRNSLATYVLPSIDEWYKAAYYDPNTSTYFDYANGSNTAPTAVASGTAPNTAVYFQPFGQIQADITQAGSLSPFGIMGLGGNVWEWQETEHDLLNDTVSSNRRIRGGGWANSRSDLKSTSGGSPFGAADENLSFIGFRVASVSSAAAPAAVPEPGSFAVLSLMGVAGWWNRGRKKK